MTATVWNLRTTALIGFCLLLACARATPPPLLSAEPPREASQSTSVPPAAEATPTPAPSAAETGAEIETETEVPPEPRAAREDPEPPPPDRELTPIPARVRVGLATDLDSMAFPCCDQNLVAMVNGEQLAAVVSMLVEPAVTITEPPVWRLQVAALRDERQAEELARRLGATLAAETKVVFDAGTGFYRVRVGSFSSRAQADEARTGLAQRNIHDAWIVSEQPAVEDPALRLTQGDRAWIVRGRWLAFESPEGRGVSALGRRYRGRILVYLNNRGTLNLINEVGLDEYLRGVVPREMGPEVYDEIEALKAQAVAARSYTLRNMGEFSEEGYDICATPRCQVYGGMDAENPLSDRAVLETSGEVLAHLGEYADALYSSTCGGHTENVEVVFPLKEAAYLRGVPCHEAGIERIEGALERGLPLEQGLSRVLAPPASPGRSATDFAVRLKMLASAAGLAPVSEALVTLERRELQRFLAAQLGLRADARLMVAAEDVPYLLEDPPADWSDEDLRLAAYLVRMGFFSGPVSRPLSQFDLDEVIFRTGLFLRVLEERRARYLGIEFGSLIVKEEDGRRRYNLPESLATFTRQGDRFVSAPLALVPGDRLRLYLRAGRLLALGQEVDLDGVSYDRTSNFSSWTRYRSREDLQRRVGERYPGFELDDLAVLERGVSGRVRRLLLIGTDFETIEVSGLPIRWTLDLPDTLFTAKKLTPPGSGAGWLFSGRGWGHGVGMCQVGSYGMALRGHSYRDILNHYYTGVDIVAAPREPAAPRAGLR